MRKSTEEIKERVRGIIEPVINELGIEIDDIELGKGLLRVYIDKAEGITIDDCERVSHEIDPVLDVEDPIPFSYVLEVSSPGLDRPLKKPRDFQRFLGATVRVVTLEPLGKQTFFAGKIVAANDTEVVLGLPGDKELVIPYRNISKARLEVEV